MEFNVSPCYTGLRHTIRSIMLVLCPMYFLNEPTEGLDTVSYMMLNDFLTNLPDALCVKTERAATAVGLDLRAPILDTSIIRFAWRMPLSYKYREGKTKWPLREVLSRYIPKEIIDRPKMGFRVPIGEWLRGPMREWAEDLLSPERMKREGLLNGSYIQNVWSDHLKGHNDWTDACGRFCR